MHDAIRDQLELLYGPATGATAMARLANLIEQHREQLAPPSERAAPHFTAADVLLITYADQLREPNYAPLRTLADFAARHLRGVVSGVHLLPFYPWSSDDGFSVKVFSRKDRAGGRRRGWPWVLGHCPDRFLHSKLRESANPPDSHPTLSIRGDFSALAYHAWKPEPTLIRSQPAKVPHPGQG